MGRQLVEVDVGPVHGPEVEVNGEAYAVETTDGAEAHGGASAIDLTRGGALRADDEGVTRGRLQMVLEVWWHRR
jgi:hypothetical protein